MGDRTWASITYPAWAEPLLAAAQYPERGDFSDFWGDERQLAYDGSWDVDRERWSNTTQLGESECNYGNHPQADVCRELGIPFDTRWDNGGEYSAGEGFARVGANGQLEEHEYYHEAAFSEIARLVYLLHEKGPDAAAKRLAEIAAAGFFREVRPIERCAPTPQQIDRLIELLCPDEPDEAPAQAVAA